MFYCFSTDDDDGRFVLLGWGLFLNAMPGQLNERMEVHSSITHMAFVVCFFRRL